MSKAFGPLIGSANVSSARPYPERAESEAGWHDRFASFLYGATFAPAVNCMRHSRRRLGKIVELVEQHRQSMCNAQDSELTKRAFAMRGRLRREGFTPELAGECFAIVQEAAQRSLGYRYYETQLMGGWALLQGKLVEMATGEGKTFAATLPACTAAFAGYPVHVITVNDYLANRDAHEMAPLYEFLGLNVGVVVEGMPRHSRQKEYAKAITYCTNKELAFDYLRDGVALDNKSNRLHLALEKLYSDRTREKNLVLQGLYFCRRILG